jgi:hypothetical protein
MTYKPNDLIAWEGNDGILNYGQEYHVGMVRDGRRAQEFTLKYRNGHKVIDRAGSVSWWEVGTPFIRRQKAVINVGIVHNRNWKSLNLENQL